MITFLNILFYVSMINFVLPIPTSHHVFYPLTKFEANTQPVHKEIKKQILLRGRLDQEK